MDPSQDGIDKKCCIVLQTWRRERYYSLVYNADRELRGILRKKKKEIRRVSARGRKQGENTSAEKWLSKWKVWVNNWLKDETVLKKHKVGVMFFFYFFRAIFYLLPWAPAKEGMRVQLPFLAFHILLSKLSFSLMIFKVL